MFCVNPVIELVNDPVPVPLLVFVDSEIVGFIDVDQTTPLAVTVKPPSDVTIPPEVAVVDDIPDIAVVETIGIEVDVSVVKLTSFPYVVPCEVVAYDLT